MEELLATVILAVVFAPPVVVGVVIGWFVRGRKERRKDSAVVVDHQRLDRLVEDIQYHAYQQMTLGDGALAPIVVDLIRESEKSRADQTAIQQARHGQQAQKTPFIHLTSVAAPDPSARPAHGLSSATPRYGSPHVAPPVSPVSPAPPAPPASTPSAYQPPTYTPASEETR